MALFLATHHNRVDKKGRVSVPAQFRAAIADQAFQGIVVFPSHKAAALEGFSMGQMEQLSANIDSFDMFSDAHDDLATTMFGSSVPLPFDGEGRIVLPKDLCTHAGITDAVAFVGLGKKFQIWEPEAFAAHQAAAQERMRHAGQTVPTRPVPNGGGAS